MRSPPRQASPADPLTTVVLERISKRFGRQAALARVSLTLRRGQTCVIVGENGAGKSTLLSLLAMELVPDEGTLRYETAEGNAVTGGDLRRRLGYVSHQPMVYPELSALENVTFFARIGGMADPKQRAADFVEQMGLDPRSTQPAAEFSRGMQARLAAARALVTDPELLLLDEATSGLDRDGRATLVELVRAEAAERIVCVITHQLSTAAALAEQLVVLRRGRLAHLEDLADLSTDEKRATIERLLHEPPAG